MTSGMAEKERQAVVKRATIVAFVTLVVFAFTGQLLFRFFGISTNGLRMAGGIIIFVIGYDMLQARIAKIKLKEEEIKTYANDISVTPFAIPMLCGAQQRLVRGLRVGDQRDRGIARRLGPARAAARAAVAELREEAGARLREHAGGLLDG